MKGIKGKSVIWHTLINMMLITMIFALYFLMADTKAVSVLGSNIIYKTDDKESVAFECIVAWDSTNIDKLLNVLKKENVAITFVVSGTFCEENPSTLRQLTAEGHAVATCGMNYSDTASLDPGELAASIKKSVGIIETLADIKVAYYYCPTRDTVKASRAAKAAGLLCVRSSVDLLSARGDVKSICDRAKNNTRGADIVSFTPTMNMISALPQVFEQYRSRQLEIKPVMK